MTAEEHFDAANLCEIHEEYTKAIEHYSKAIELQPHFPEAYYNRAGDRELEGDIAGAIRDYEMAIRQDPAQPISYLCLADIYLNDEHEQFFSPQKAVPLAKEACHLTTNQSFEALAALSRAYAVLGRYREATKCLERAIGILRGTVPVAQEHQPPVDGEVWLPDMESRLETYKKSCPGNWWQRVISRFRRR